MGMRRPRLSAVVMRKFRTFMRDSRQLISDKKKTQKFLEAVARFVKDHQQALRAVREDIETLCRFLRAIISGKYKKMPWKIVGYSAAGLVYLLSPIDAIPDFLPVIGFTDDVAVITWVVWALKEDLTEFREWEKNNNPTADES